MPISSLAFYLIAALSCDAAITKLEKAYATGNIRKLAPNRRAEKKIDRALGVDYGVFGDKTWTIPEGISASPWASLPEDTGWSSEYGKIILILRQLDLQPGDQVVDLGSGYGRFLLVAALLHPDVHFIGYEINPHRFEMSKKWLHQHFDLKNITLIHEDFGNPVTPFPKARYFYSYDTLRNGNAHTVLEHLRNNNHQSSLVVLHGNGDAEKTLEQVKDFQATHVELNYPRMRIYQLRGGI